MSDDECPICARASTERQARGVPPSTAPCDHTVFVRDATGYVGAGFALQYCHVYIERDLSHGKTFLETDREIVDILRQYMEIIDGRGYAKFARDALDRAVVAVRRYLRDLGYTLPE